MSLRFLVLFTLAFNGCAHFRLSFPSFLLLRGGSSNSTSTLKSGLSGTQSNWTESLLRRLDAATTGEDIFELAEEIPAIRRSVDKAMRIVIANYTDAVLAAHAIQRLANVTHSNNNNAAASWIPSSLDRRFEQLTECIELRASQLHTVDLSRYCWGLSLLKIGDEEQIDVIFDEYLQRLSKNSTTSEELATMMWTVGCIKDAYDFGTNSSLVASLSSALLEKGPHSVEKLSMRLLIRILWTLAIYSTDIESFTDLHNTSTIAPKRQLSTRILDSLAPRIDELTDANAVSVLLSASKMNLNVEQFNVTAALLKKLSDDVHAGKVEKSDLSIAAEAFGSLYVQFSDLIAHEFDESPLQFRAKEMLSLVEKGAISLINVSSTIHFSSLSIKGIAAVVHLAVIVDAVDDRSILESGLRQIEALIAQNVTIAPEIAASILESIATLTWTVRRERGFHTSSSSQVVRDDASTLGVFLALQRLAGHMSSICSVYANRMKSNSWLSAAGQRSTGTLLSASWATAAYYRPCLKMMKMLQDEVQNYISSQDEFNRDMAEAGLPEILNSETILTGVSPAALGKIAIIIASEKSLAYSSSMNSGTKGNSLDADFLGKLIPCVTGVLREVRPPGLLIAAANAIAELSQRSSGTAAETSISPELQCIRMPASELNKLRTTSLLKFLWAASRLPDGMVSNSTIAAGNEVLLERKINVGYGMGRYSSNSVHATEFMLLARLLFDARRPDGRQDNNFIEAVLRNILKALLAHVPDTLSSETSSLLGDAGGLSLAEAARGRDSGHVQEGSSADLVALSEIIRALIDFKVFNAELASLCDRCIQKELQFHIQHSDDSSSSCRRLFDIGRLESFLAIYRSTLSQENKDKKFKFFG